MSPQNIINPQNNNNGTSSTNGQNKNQSITCTKPITITLKSGTCIPNNIEVSTYVKNTGACAVDNVCVQLNVPSGFTFIKGSQAQLLSLKPNEEVKVTWTLSVPTTVSNTIPLSVQITSDSTNTITIK